MADADAMKREAARHIEAQIASTSLDPEPPDNRKKVTSRFPTPKTHQLHVGDFQVSFKLFMQVSYETIIKESLSYYLLRSE